MNEMKNNSENKLIKIFTEKGRKKRMKWVVHQPCI